MHSPGDNIHMYAGTYYIHMYGEPITCVHRLYYTCPCAHTGTHHVYTKGHYTYLHSETRTYMYIHVLILVYAEPTSSRICTHRVLSHVYAETLFTYMHIEALSHMCTVIPSSHVCPCLLSHVCTQEPHQLICAQGPVMDTSIAHMITGTLDVYI